MVLKKNEVNRPFVARSTENDPLRGFSNHFGGRLKKELETFEEDLMQSTIYKTSEISGLGLGQYRTETTRQPSGNLASRKSETKPDLVQPYTPAQLSCSLHPSSSLQ